jgi:RNA polymerase sigma-70 factor (ECF subfamily)
MTHFPLCAERTFPWDWTTARALCLAEAQRILGRGPLAEDAAQEAVIRAWKRRDACRTPEQPASWLITIARREAFRAVRKRPHEEALTALAAVASPDTEPFALHTDLVGALGRLSGDDQALILGRYWEDLPDHVLALRFGVAETTVRVRLHRVRARLRQTLLET